MFKKHIIFQILYVIVGPPMPMNGHGSLTTAVTETTPSFFACIKQICPHCDIDMWGRV